MSGIALSLILLWGSAVVMIAALVVQARREHKSAGKVLLHVDESHSLLYNAKVLAAHGAVVVFQKTRTLAAPAVKIIFSKIAFMARRFLVWFERKLMHYIDRVKGKEHVRKNRASSLYLKDIKTHKEKNTLDKLEYQARLDKE